MGTEALIYSTYDHQHGASLIASSQLTVMKDVLHSSIFSKDRLTTAHIREHLLDKLYRLGWSAEAKLDPVSSITVTSVSGSTGLCLQTGNMARIYADLLKLQLLFHREKITGALYLLFSKHSANQLGENIANFDRLTRELQLFSDIITVPIVVFGLEVV
jgi:hypothetical protein